MDEQPDIRNQVNELLSEVTEKLRELKTHLIGRVDSAAISKTAKIPFVVAWYRAAASWRLAELCESAVEDFSRDRIVSGILLTRAAVETVASMWYMNVKVKASLAADSVGNINEQLRRLAAGSRTDPKMYEAINVLNFIDSVDTTISRFRDQYDKLSEFSHPNWAGTVLLFSKPDIENRWADLSSNIRVPDNSKVIGLANLSVTLLVFEHTRTELANLMPSFTALCERDLKKASI